MADFKSLQKPDGTEFIGTDGKLNYAVVASVPAAVLDTSTHYHDDMYPSKFNIEDRFTTVMNKVQAMTQALQIRPLKTKGFLNGGYKSSYVYSRRVQRFNTVTETGVEIGKIGTVTSQYSPGASSELKGYFFGDTADNTAYFDSTGRYVDQLVYLTEVETYLGLLTHHNTDSTLYNVYSQSQIYLCDAGTSWSKLSVATNTVALQTSGVSGRGCGRQGLSSETFGYVTNAGSALLTTQKYTYLTATGSTGTTQTIAQHAAGLTKDKDIGYWVDYGTANNWKVNMLTNTVANVYCFTQGFGESNTLGSELVGFAMGGYDGIQHGYVQKLVWATDTASNVLGGSLAIPQSSAGMVES